MLKEKETKFFSEKVKKQDEKGRFFTNLAQGHFEKLQNLDIEDPDSVKFEFDPRLHSKIIKTKKGREALKQGVLSLINNHRIKEVRELLDHIPKGIAEKIKKNSEIKQIVKEKVVEILNSDPNYYKAQGILEIFRLDDEEEKEFWQSEQLQKAGAIMASHYLKNTSKEAIDQYKHCIGYFQLKPETTKQAVKQAYKAFLETKQLSKANILLQEIDKNKKGEYYRNSDKKIKSIVLLEEFKQDPDIIETAQQYLQKVLDEIKTGKQNDISVNDEEFINEYFQNIPNISAILKDSALEILKNGKIDTAVDILKLTREKDKIIQEPVFQQTALEIFSKRLANIDYNSLDYIREAFRLEQADIENIFIKQIITWINQKKDNLIKDNLIEGFHRHSHLSADEWLTIKQNPEFKQAFKNRVFEFLRQGDINGARNYLDGFLGEAESNAFLNQEEIKTAIKQGLIYVLTTVQDSPQVGDIINFLGGIEDLKNDEQVMSAVKTAIKESLKQGLLVDVQSLLRKFHIEQNKVKVFNDSTEKEAIMKQALLLQFKHALVSDISSLLNLIDYDRAIFNNLKQDPEIKQAGEEGIIFLLTNVRSYNAINDYKTIDWILTRLFNDKEIKSLKEKPETQQAVKKVLMDLLQQGEYNTSLGYLEGLLIKREQQPFIQSTEFQQTIKAGFISLLHKKDYENAEKLMNNFIKEKEREKELKNALLKTLKQGIAFKAAQEALTYFSDSLNDGTKQELKSIIFKECLSFRLKQLKLKNAQEIAGKAGQEKILQDICWNYPEEMFTAVGGYTVHNSVFQQIIERLETGLDPKEIAQEIEKKLTDEYSPLNFVRKEQENQEPREINDIPKIEQGQIIKDMGLFAEYGFLFNEQKMNLDQNLQKKILGNELFQKIESLKKQAENLESDQIEMEIMFNLIDFKSGLRNDLSKEEINQYAILFHGTNKQAAQDIASRTGLFIGNRAKTGAYISTRSSISFEQYALTRDAVSGARTGEKGGMIMFSREALKKSHVQGVRQDLNKSNGYTVDESGVFIRIPMQASLNVSADNREELQKNIYKTLYTIQEAKKQGLNKAIEQKFFEYLGEQGNLHFTEIYKLMRNKKYPEAKIVETRDSYIRYFLLSQNGDIKAGKEYQICQKILKTYKNQDIEKVKEKADIAMIIDTLGEYPEIIDQLKNIQEKTAEQIETDIQKQMQILQEEKFLDGIQAMRAENQLYDKFKKQIAFLKTHGHDHGLLIKDYAKLKSVMCGEINGENIQEIHENVLKIEQDLIEMNQETLKIAEQEAWNRSDFGEDWKKILIKHKDKYCIAVTGSIGRGTPILSSDLDFVIYLNDAELTEIESSLITSYLVNFKQQIISILEKMSFVKIDAAQMNTEPIVKLSTVQELVINPEQERQQVEPISLIESKPVNQKHEFILEFQKTLLGKSESIQALLKEELKREKYFRWIYSVSELLSGDSIKDFKKDISRTIDWTLMLMIIKRIPDEIYKIDKELLIPADMLGKVEILEKYNVLSEEENQKIKEIIIDIARWRLRGDIVSQGADQVNFDVMLMTNKERQRFLGYAKFINSLIPDEVKQGVKEDIIIN